MQGYVNDNELLLVIKKMFVAYRERQRTGTLYTYDRQLPKIIIKLYYSLEKENRNLDELTEQFIQHYINEECLLEDTHEGFEKEGLKAMYEYIHTAEITRYFSVYKILDLHKKLYSKAPCPEAGGIFRNDNVYLPGTGVNLSDHRNIWDEIVALNEEVKEILELGEQVEKDKNLIFEYIEKCVMLKCKLIKIHPFMDGNGRTVRAFINRLFLNVGLPSIYILQKEDAQYRAAMQKAIGEEEDPHSIIQFCYYKICDSIFELDIAPKLESVLGNNECKGLCGHTCQKRLKK